MGSRRWWDSDCAKDMRTQNDNRFPETTQLSLMTVALVRFHSAFLAENNKVFVCGNGSGGRLGTGDESALMVPGEVPVFRRHHVKVVQVSALLEIRVSRKSRKTGSDTGSVAWACSLNSHHIFDDEGCSRTGSYALSRLRGKCLLLR